MSKPRAGVIYIISNVDRWIAFEWIAAAFAQAAEPITFILLNPDDSHLERHLLSQGHSCHRITWRGYSDTLSAFWALWGLLKQLRPTSIHAHFLHANLLGLTVAWLQRIPNRIFTRHHSTFHHDFAPKGVWLDKYSNRLATRILAITGLVRDILIEREGVPEHKITIVHHGFHFDAFLRQDGRSITTLREKYKLQPKQKVLGVVARHIYWKGVQDIIAAFKKLYKQYPDLVLFLANARGNHHEELMKQLQELPSERYRVVPFEPQIESLFYLFDYYVHTPIDGSIEAFGQTYVEALACARPSVFTLSGIAHDYIKHEHNALVVPYQNPEAIADSVARLIKNPDIAGTLAQTGKEDVLRLFSFEQMQDKLQTAYRQHS